MIIYCKGCGEEIELRQGQKTAVCGFCGLEQTLPVANTPEKMARFIKANEQRLACHFDVAKKMYDEIIKQFPDDNEAYWCKLLCEYGIEYVDDFATQKMIPTCHRTIPQSIFDNKDYQRIIKRATADEKLIYEAEAKEIDRIQKEILANVEKQESYDIFICYKESNGDGRRTKDSQIANKLYTNLVEKGYKVFFARVTLNNMAGSKYEPVIYSALTTAKVMLLVSTSKEHIDAPWVRNEWSRFLEFMEADISKVIVPCISVMDPYDLPEELIDFQVLCTSDMDFTETLTRQIDSKFGRNVNPQPRVVEIVSSIRTEENTTNNVESQEEKQMSNYAKRAEIFIEDGDWSRADEFIEKILDMNPHYAKAYLLKALLDYKVTSVDKLKNKNGFSENPNFNRAIRYGDEKMVETLTALKKFDKPTPAPPKQEVKPPVQTSIKREETISREQNQIKQTELKVPNLKVGDTYKFGRYYQSNSINKEEIEWQVLAKEGNRALLISKYGLDSKPYNKTITNVTWETCTLREWLNNDFINVAFTSEEKAKIPTVTVRVDENLLYSTNPGNATQDKVFLLSITEAEKYFTTYTARECKPTAYAKAQGAFVSSSNGKCWWWLRSLGSNQDFASEVLNGGYVNYFGNFVNYDSGAVRPAMWVNLDVVDFPQTIMPRLGLSSSEQSPIKREETVSRKQRPIRQTEIFVCKNCGEEIAYEKGATSVLCDFCGKKHILSNGELIVRRCGNCGARIVFENGATRAECYACDTIQTLQDTDAM